MTTATKKRSKKLPALGWCNIVISRLEKLSTQKAMGFTCWRDSLRQHGKIQHAGGKWYHCEMDYGHGLSHPLDLPARFVQTLWWHRNRWYPWDGHHLASEAIHGVEHHTKMKAVLDLLWAVKYAKQAYVAASKKADQRAEIVQMLAGLFPPPLLPTTVTPESFAKMLLTKTFKIFYVNDCGEVKDISNLDPDSQDDDVSSWGQLTTLSERAGKIVSQCVNLYLDR